MGSLRLVAAPSTCLFHVSNADDVRPVLQGFSKEGIGHSQDDRRPAGGDNREADQCPHFSRYRQRYCHAPTQSTHPTSFLSVCVSALTQHYYYYALQLLCHDKKFSLGSAIDTKPVMSSCPTDHGCCDVIPWHIYDGLRLSYKFVYSQLL